ncbi:MAG: type VI secretion system baseplate subunit TssE [Succinivibrionaceae bacterium]
MSLLGRLRGKQSTDLDDLCNDIIENITGILSSRAPILKTKISYKSYAYNSIVMYGIKNTMRFQKKYHGKFIFEEIIELINKFEPRLQDVQIEQNDTDDNTNLFNFKIRGVIQMGDMEDSVLFDSCLDFGSNIFRVRKINFV